MITFNIDLIKELETYWFLMIYYHQEYADIQAPNKNRYPIYALNSLHNWLGVECEKDVKLLKDPKFYSIFSFFKRLKIKENIKYNLVNELTSINYDIYHINNEKFISKLDKLKIKFNLQLRLLIIQNLKMKLENFL